ncbi:MAG: asparagine synthase-related protein, partial [Candidatus Helarchaeales archaeon]
MEGIKTSFTLHELNDRAMKALNQLKTSSINIRQIHENELNACLQRFDEHLSKMLYSLRGRKIGLLFSGGLDSSVLAAKLKQLNLEFTPLFVGVKNERDHRNAIESARALRIKLEEIHLDEASYEAALPELIKIISTS